MNESGADLGEMLSLPREGRIVCDFGMALEPAACPIHGEDGMPWSYFLDSFVKGSAFVSSDDHTDHRREDGKEIKKSLYRKSWLLPLSRHNAKA
jgi:hypothetical protein